jgi:acyl-CoA reductase-like NAD-dependent aldehyde dehydrogenase
MSKNMSHVRDPFLQYSIVVYRKVGDLLEEKQDELANILTRENGKPLAEAKV